MWYQPRNPVLRPLQVVVNWFQRRHWLSPKRSASPTESHEMLRQALNDPETALLLRRALTGPVLPFAAGTCGSRNDGAIPKFCDAPNAPNTLDDSVITQNSGNIGIGTATPQYKLDVASSVGNGAQSYIRVTDTTADVTGGLYGGVNATLVIGAQRAGFSDGAAGILDVTTNHPLFLKTNDQTRMTILGGGNVGIGTSSPGTTLDVAGPIRFQGYAKASLPSAGTTGRLARVTDVSRSLWMDQGSQWFNLSGEVYNVKEFGAKGDGTTDDTSAIQAAITAAAATGGRVVFPPGVYLVSNLTGASNVQLWGAGASATTVSTNNVEGTTLRFKSGSSGDMIKFEGKSNFSIRNIQWDYNSLSADGTAIAIANNGGGNPSTHFDITDCSIINIDCTSISNAKYGIIVVASNNFWIERNYIKFSVSSNKPNEAIATTADANTYNGVINANHCDGSAIQADGHDMKVTNNRVHDFKFGGGITVNPASSNHDNLICGNSVYNSTGRDISETWCNGIENWGPRTVISNNVCHNNSGSGIGNAASQCIVTNNTCYDNGVGVASPNVNYDTFGITIVYGSSTYNASESVYLGNRCFDTRSGGSKTQTYGIADLSSGGSSGPFSSDVTIGMNNLSGNKDGEMNIQGSNYAQFLHISGGAVALSAPASAPTDADLNASNLSFWIEESTSPKKLMFNAKLSDGTTVLTGSVDLG